MTELCVFWVFFSNKVQKSIAVHKRKVTEGDRKVTEHFQFCHQLTHWNTSSYKQKWQNDRTFWKFSIIFISPLQKVIFAKITYWISMSYNAKNPKKRLFVVESLMFFVFLCNYSAILFFNKDWLRRADGSTKFNQNFVE